MSAATDAPPAIDHEAVVERYMRGVLDGTVPACKLIRQCVARHVDDLKRWGTYADDGNPKHARRPYYFDPDASRAVLDFVIHLRHWEGDFAGQWFIPSPWQAFIIWVIFGWLRSDTHTRRFTVAHIEIPRKNGKSTLISAILLYLLIADGEAGAQVYSAATKRDQAKIVFECAKNMVKDSPELDGLVEIVKNNISMPLTRSKFEPLASEEKSLHGLNLHAAGVDELHAHKTREVYDVLNTARGARTQALLISITTAGYDRESVCYEQTTHVRDILDPASGVVDDRYFGFIATIDEEDDWQSELAWAKANPNLGVSIYRDTLEDEARRAAQIPSRRNTFLRLHLNVWTDQAEVWIPPEKWDACAWLVGGKPEPVDAPGLRGCQCFAGLDLAHVRDTSALVLDFPMDLDEGKVAHALLAWFWCPEGALTNQDFTEKKREKLRRWADAGYLTLTPGEVTDQNFIQEKILEVATLHEIVALGMDPFNAQQLRLNLESSGLTVVEIYQTFKGLNSFCKSLETTIVQGLLDHGGHPILRDHALGTVIITDPAANIRPDRKKCESSIDGMISLIMAHGLATVTQGDAPSVYEDRGVLVL